MAFREVPIEKAPQAPAPKLPDVQRQVTRLPVKTIIEPFRIKASDKPQWCLASHSHSL